MRVLALVVCLSALGLRLSGTTHGLPYLYHPDEQNVLYRGLVLPTQHWVSAYSLNGPMHTYLTTLGAGLLYMGGLVTGAFTDVVGMLTAVRTDPAVLVLPLRIGVALLSWLAVPLALVGFAPFVGPRRAMLIAAFLAFNPLAVLQSHFVQCHAVSITFTLAFLACCLRTAAGWRGPWHAAAGVALGLAIAAKTYNIHLLPLLAIAARPSRRAVIALVAAVGTYLVCVPAILIAPLHYLTELARALRAAPGSPHVSSGSAGTLLYNFTEYMPGWMGPAAMVLAAAGLVIACRRATRTDALFAGCLLFLPVLACGFNYERYALPLLVPVAYFAALAIESASLWLSGSGTPLVILAAIVLVPWISLSLRLERVLASPDTRTLAARWIESHVAAGTPVVVDGIAQEGGSSRFGVQLRASPAQLAAEMAQARAAGAGARYVEASLRASSSRVSYGLSVVNRLDEWLTGLETRSRPRPRPGTILVATDWLYRNALPRGGFHPHFERQLQESCSRVVRFEPSPRQRWDPLCQRLDPEAIRSTPLFEGRVVNGPTVLIGVLR